MAKLFGTDGVRGIVGQEMNPDFAFRLALAAGRVLRGGAALIGRDTRASGEMLEKAVAEGLSAAGLEVWLAGVATTPAVAHLTPALGAAVGVVISASHNPHQYNGIKFISGGGCKFPDEQLEEIEELFHGAAVPPKARGGKVIPLVGAQQRYIDHLLAAGKGTLAGRKLVLDCANGAAFSVAPEVFRGAGAAVECIGVSPDGTNINAHCGSLHTSGLQRAVVAAGAEAGVAFDGDADRAILVDERGNIVDGDHMLAFMAREMKDSGRLPGDLVVGTTMSGLGLEISLREAGCRLLRAKVGDRYVLEMMQAEGANLGGEPSGHIIFLDRANTGDGLLTGLEALGVMVKNRAPLSQLAAVMQPLPQVMLNLPLRDNRAWQKDPEISAAITATEAALGDEGRLVVRASGTEPVVRIMVEGTDRERISAAAQGLADALSSRYGL